MRHTRFKNSPEYTDATKTKSTNGPCTQKIIHEYFQALREYMFVKMLYFHYNWNLETKNNHRYGDIL